MRLYVGENEKKILILFPKDKGVPFLYVGAAVFMGRNRCMKKLRLYPRT